MVPSRMLGIPLDNAHTATYRWRQKIELDYKEDKIRNIVTPCNLFDIRKYSRKYKLKDYLWGWNSVRSFPHLSFL